MIRSRLLVSTGLGIVAALGWTFDGRASETIDYSYDALGRLVSAESTGSVNNNQAHSICYDPAGNRTQYQSTGTGMVAGCATIPPPESPPPPGNTPPVAVNDSKTVSCQQLANKDLTANDTDADGDLPVMLTNVSRISGLATAEIVSASSVEIYSESAGTTIYQYTIEDTRGASDTGQLTITTTNGAGCF